MSKIKPTDREDRWADKRVGRWIQVEKSPGAKKIYQDLRNITT
ncbi:hypothetical protein [Coleofasciculus sp. H7-2]